jgi:hypothetical protein
MIKVGIIKIRLYQQDALSALQYPQECRSGGALCDIDEKKREVRIFCENITLVGDFV